MHSADDYYADPTLFDRCHARLAAGAHRVLVHVQPFLWGLVFHGFALACYLILVITLADFAVADTLAPDAAGLRSLAATLAAAMALCGGIHFQRVGVQAWPAPGAGGPRTAHAAVPAARPIVANERRLDGPVRREEARVFLEAVREAGVNLTIARALIRGGIRSTRKLRHASDADLLAIPGVGPATVARLRRRFG